MAKRRNRRRAPKAPARQSRQGQTRPVQQEQQAMQVAAGDGQRPAPPDVPESKANHTRALIEMASGGTSVATLLKRYKKGMDNLLPQRTEEDFVCPIDMPEEMKSEYQRRQVRTPYLYLQSQMTVAMAMPSNYEWSLEPVEQVQPIGMQSDQVGKDPFLVSAARSAELLQRRFLDEIPWLDTLESVIQQADLFGPGILKITWRADIEEGFLNNLRRHDVQDQQQRALDIIEMMRQGDVQPYDPEAEELKHLLEAIKQPGELLMDVGLDVGTVPLPALYVDPAVAGTERIMNARFMSEFVPKTRREVRMANPFRIKEDGSWTGVHPDDLARAAPWGMAGNDWLKKQALRREEPGKYGDPDDDVLMVIELWHHEEQRVYRLLPEVDYPLKSWTPQKQPKQWYPYNFAVLRPVPDSWEGIGLVELGADLQKVSHLKVSDDNIHRYLSLPRWVYDTNQISDKVAQAIGQILPGMMGGVPLRGDKLSDALMEAGANYRPGMSDDSREQADLRRVGNTPEQMQGATGVSHHAKEVQAAMAGVEIHTNYLLERVKRFLKRTHGYIHELIYMNLARQLAMQMLGKYGIYPEMLSRDQAKALSDKIDRKLDVQLLRMQEVATMLGRPMTEITWRSWRENARQSMITKLTGMPELITREELYTQLAVKVEVATNAELEQQNRRASFNESLTAASAHGLIANPVQLGRVLERLYNQGDEFAGLFEVDPNKAAQMLLSNPQGLAPETIVALQQLLGQIEVPVQQGAPPGAPAPASP